MSMIERLTRFVVARSSDDLSRTTPHTLKLRVLDTLGWALGALDAVWGTKDICDRALSYRSANDETSLVNPASGRT
jgi:hypothetical protein